MVGKGTAMVWLPTIRVVLRAGAVCNTNGWVRSVRAGKERSDQVKADIQEKYERQKDGALPLEKSGRLRPG